MKMELNREQLYALVCKQINNLFFYCDQTDGPLLSKFIDISLKECEYCFSFSTNKYYKKNDEIYFNPLHSGQYTIFLYYLSRLIWDNNPDVRSLCDRIYYLNKTLNGLDLYYEVRMPKIFSLDHPVGSVLGRATYGNFFSFSQNTTVGNNKGVYPTFATNVSLKAGVTIVGNCNVGENVIISANSYVKDTDIPPCSIVFGSSPNLTIKKMPVEYFLE